MCLGDAQVIHVEVLVHLERLQEQLLGFLVLRGEVVQLGEDVILEEDVDVESRLVLLHDEVKHLQELVQIFILELGAQ